MLLFPPEAVMIADDTNGPINADVFPICGGDLKIWVLGRKTTAVTGGVRLRRARRTRTLEGE